MTIPLLPDDPYDQKLRANVRPPGWVNPRPAGRYHLVVIGAGPAGLVAAAVAAGLGAKVALVERDLLGGDCLNVGCVPSKALLRSARAATEVRHATEFGVRLPGDPQVDFAAVMDRVRRVRADLSPVDSAERFRAFGVDVFLGEGRFVNENTVGVGGSQLRFSRCLIATGSKSVIPDTPGLKGKAVYTHESIFTLTTRPERLLVLGGGPVGCELGQAFARVGSTVGIVTRTGRVLPKEDDDVVQAVEASLRRDGIAVGTGPFEADTVLVAAGLRPNVAGLNLDAARVAFDPGTGVTVDDHLRTTNPRVFAAGDVCSLGYKFTHAADAMARLVVRNALSPSRAKASALLIPRCTYTDPEVGQVGLTEREAIDRNVPVNVYRLEFREVDRPTLDGADGFAKVLVAAGTDRLVGATVVGPHAGELIGTFSLAMTHGLGLKKLANTIFPYPTYTEALRKIADRYNRTRFTPLARRIFGTWLKWFR